MAEQLFVEEEGLSAVGVRLGEDEVVVMVALSFDLVSVDWASAVEDLCLSVCLFVCLSVSVSLPFLPFVCL